MLSPLSITLPSVLRFFVFKWTSSASSNTRSAATYGVKVNYLKKALFCAWRSRDPRTRDAVPPGPAPELLPASQTRRCLAGSTSHRGGGAGDSNGRRAPGNAANLAALRVLERRTSGTEILQIKMVTLPAPLWSPEITLEGNSKIRNEVQQMFQQFKEGVEELLSKNLPESSNQSLMEQTEVTPIESMVFYKKGFVPIEECQSSMAQNNVKELSHEEYPALPGQCKIKEENQTKFDNSWVEITKRKQRKKCASTEDYLPISNMFDPLSDTLPQNVEAKPMKKLPKKSNKQSNPKFNFTESTEDITQLPKTTSIAIFMDENFSKKGVGLARRIDRRFHVMDVLEAQTKRVGQVAVAKHGKRYIIAVILKRNAMEKTSPQNLTRAMESVKKMCQILNIKDLACPRVGHSITGFHISEFKRQTRQIFFETDINLHIIRNPYLIKAQTNSSFDNQTPLETKTKVCDFSGFCQLNAEKENRIKARKISKTKTNIPQESRIHNYFESGNRKRVLTFRDFLKDDIYQKMNPTLDIPTETVIPQLRYTQLVAIASLLLNEKNTLAQVNTGEGKSLIVVALALLKALRNEQVDIITCSRLLAIRDAESEPPKGYKDIYNLFGINVSHNCSEQLELRTNAYSANQVIYGEIGSFQRDYLLDRFYGKNVMGDRNFKNVIVDEVDSMLLDKGNNILYLSQNIPMFDKLEPVLLYIWQIVNSVDSDNYNEDYIKRRVISEISPTIDINSFRVLDKNLTETDLRKLWLLLKQNKIINEFGNIIVKENISVVIKSALNLDYPHLIPRTIYLFQYKLMTEGNLKIPEYLKPFVLLHVDSWVENAISALLMMEGTDYVVDVDRSNSSPDINPIVTIIDNDTGTDFSNSQWENGLHQFLQMKHGCRLSPMSLKSVFISNVTYFKLYHKMHGLSGTLGSEVEREYLKEIHNVDFISVPTARCKRYEEYTPIVSNTCDEWKNNVFGRCMTVVKEQNRSALIICENIATAENMYTHFKNRLNGTDHQIKLHLYKRDYEEFQFAQGNVPLDTGHVIIATNLAGRGTDIKLSELLVKNGGLHVCVTYLPPNLRVEQQAFGRVSRSGEPGSSQLVILNENNNETNIIKLKIERSKNEVKNTILTKSHYQNITKTEETLFETFKDQYRYLKEKVYENQQKFKSKNYTEISNLILNESLNIWAFWLDKTSTETKNNCNGATSDLVKRFECFEKKFSNILYINPLHWNQIFNDEFDSYSDINPTLLIKIAKELSNMSKEILAVNVFDHVIKLEPHFCEIAHYYAAYAILKDRKWNDLNKSEDGIYSQAVGHLNAADVLFQDRKRFCMQFAATAAEIEQRVHAREVQIIKIDALKQQK
ncbi:hypothetical protein B566_EDAN014116, partial [Ephemera danica]